MGSIASHNLLLFGFPSCLDFAAAAAGVVVVVAVVVMRFLGLFRFCLFCGR